MEVTVKVDGDEELSRVLGELEHWRAQRSSMRERIPEQLWERATSLARRHGVSRIATLLRLGHAALGRRVALASRQAPAALPEPQGPQFVELFAPAAPSSPSPSPVQATEPEAAQCVVELVNVRGTKMRVVLGGTGVAGLSALCQAFCAAG